MPRGAGARRFRERQVRHLARAMPAGHFDGQQAQQQHDGARDGELDGGGAALPAGGAKEGDKEKGGHGCAVWRDHDRLAMRAIRRDENGPAD